MPAHNRAKVIGRAIDSVLAQDFSDFELIVVDDGSSDNTVDIARSYADPRIQIIRFEQNRGGNAARNAGIRRARAPLIAFLDSDDEYLPVKLSGIVEFFDAHLDVDVLVDSFVKLAPGFRGPRRINRINRTITDPEVFRRGLFNRNLWKATSAISARKPALNRVGLFDESLRRLQDFDLLVRLSATSSCYAIDRITWIKHSTDDAISAAADTLIPSYIELSLRHPQMLENPAYRHGLARVVVRQIARDLIRGRVRGAAANINRLGKAFGWSKTRSLLLEGSHPSPRS